jgi:hypothetical protein
MGKGVRVMMLAERDALERILEYVIAANTAQLNDPAFVAELRSLIRFGAHEAIQTGDGLYSVTSGNPSLQRWLGRRFFNLLFAAKSENDKYATQLRSSAGVAVFISELNDKARCIESRRCYERFALQATALAIRNAMLNQPVEVSALRPQFSAAFGMGSGRPDLVVRFGRGPAMPKSLRRELQTFMV